MDTFTEKWRRAAAVASRSLDGTLYARYYDLPGPHTWSGPLAGQGFLPHQAYEQACVNGTLIAAVEDGHVLAYGLYSLPRQDDLVIRFSEQV